MLRAVLELFGSFKRAFQDKNAVRASFRVRDAHFAPRYEETKMTFRKAYILAGALAAAPLPALAAEQTLEFTLVTHADEYKEIKNPNIEGRSFSAMSAFGVAYFKDGRVAAKDFVVGGDTVNGVSHDNGLSTYHFADGSTLNLSFVGLYKDDHYHGDYTVLSGTGIYANATGSGAFDSLPTKWKTSAYLFSVKIAVKTP
jgi:hypothetical protein